jgi:hypothetical protein
MAFEKPFIHTREIISTQDVACYVVLRIPPLVHLCQICIYLNTQLKRASFYLCCVKFNWNMIWPLNFFLHFFLFFPFFLVVCNTIHWTVLGKNFGVGIISEIKP